MILLQLIICIVIPVVMITVGYKIKKGKPEFGSGGFCYRTKTAKLSEQTWQFANAAFSSISLFSGINLMITSAAFFLIAVLAADAEGWFLAPLIFAIQFVCMFSPALVTEIFLKKTFDENGELLPPKGERKAEGEE